MILFGIYCFGVTAMWVLLAVLYWRYLPRIPGTHSVEPTLQETEELPLISVVFTARDEERAIERATRSHLAQDHPNFELIVVDDDSGDRTGEILDSIEDPRLRVIHLKGNPPADWLGKNFALHQAAKRAKGEYILFTDGDVIFAPDALRLTHTHARRELADHLVVFPELEADGWLEKAFLSEFARLFFTAFPPWWVADERSACGIGVGAFNMVRREAYEGVGGHHPIRMNVDDDVALGQYLKQSGHRSRILWSRGAVRVRWQEGLVASIRGLEKNIYPATDFRAVSIFAGIFYVLSTGWAPWIAAIWGLAGGAWWLMWLGLFGLLAKLYTIEGLRPVASTPYVGIFAPLLGSVFLSAAMLNSMYWTIRRGGVSWRGRFYPKSRIRKLAWQAKKSFRRLKNVERGTTSNN